MAGVKADKPYSGYLVYKIFHRQQGRYYAVLFSLEHRTTIAWAKYVLETRLGRKLRRGYEAHHKDDDKLNDDPSNLEERESGSHRRHHDELRRLNRVVKHGTLSGYRYCKCDLCCGAKRESNRRYKGSSVQGKEPPKPTVIRHGTVVAYCYHGCRCDVCRTENTARQRDYRE